MPSTVIADIDYDAVTETLKIRFVSGLLYAYKKVPVEVFLALKNSKEKGAFLNQHIKGNFDYKKLPGK